MRSASSRSLLRARFRAGRHAGARAGDREPRAPAARAGADRRRVAQRAGARRGRLHRGVAAPGQRRGAKPARRRPARTSCRSSCCACRSRPRPPARGARSWPTSWPRSTRSSKSWTSAARPARRASRSSTCNSATTQERHAELDDAVIAAERKLADAREQLRALERQAQEAQFSARALAARRGELQRAIETAAQQVAANAQAGEQLQRRAGAASTTRPRRPGCRTRWRCKLEREAALGAARSEYDDLTAAAAPRRRAAPELERSLQPLRERITKLQLEEQAAQLGGAQYLEQLTAADGRPRRAGREHRGRRRQAAGLQTEIDRINREIAALGAVNLAALDELTAARERKTFLDAQNADLNEAIDDARRRDPQDRPRDARPAGAAPSTRSTSISAACSRACSAAATPSW